MSKHFKPIYIHDMYIFFLEAEMARNFEFLIGNVYWLFKKKNADVCIPETPPPLMSANVCNWVPPPPLKIADVLCGRPLALVLGY